MLLPALLAWRLRDRQVAALASAAPSRLWLVGRALAEGLCWGTACWIKPFVLVPAAACWLAAAVHARLSRSSAASTPAPASPAPPAR